MIGRHTQPRGSPPHRPPPTATARLCRFQRRARPSTTTTRLCRVEHGRAQQPHEVDDAGRGYQTAVVAREPAGEGHPDGLVIPPPDPVCGGRGASPAAGGVYAGRQRLQRSAAASVAGGGVGDSGGRRPVRLGRKGGAREWPRGGMGLRAVDPCVISGRVGRRGGTFSAESGTAE
jgi:hypothetical protein